VCADGHYLQCHVRSPKKDQEHEEYDKQLYDSSPTVFLPHFFFITLLSARANPRRLLVLEVLLYCKGPEP
jgi:hypothetical protein